MIKSELADVVVTKKEVGAAVCCRLLMCPTKCEQIICMPLVFLVCIISPVLRLVCPISPVSSDLVDARGSFGPQRAAIILVDLLRKKRKGSKWCPYGLQLGKCNTPLFRKTVRTCALSIQHTCESFDDHVVDGAHPKVVSWTNFGMCTVLSLQFRDCVQWFSD
jgi:hypothetical protein